MVSSPMDDPRFWFGVVALELGLPMIIPNKRWAGAAMVLIGAALVLSASGNLGALGEYIEASLSEHPSIFTAVGALVLGIGVTAFGFRIKLRWARSEVRTVAPVDPSSMPVKANRSLPRPEIVPHFSDFGSVIGISDDGIHLPRLVFTTGGQTARKISTPSKVAKLRFVVPHEQIVVEADLPTDVPIGNGRLIIKQFAKDGILLEEQKTFGDVLQAEIYFDRAGAPDTKPPREWPSLTRQQISDLRNRLAATPAIIENRDNRRIEIVREEFPDCANLADDLAEAFKTAGWDVAGPYNIWGKIANGSGQAVSRAIPGQRAYSQF